MNSSEPSKKKSSGGSHIRVNAGIANEIAQFLFAVGTQFLNVRNAEAAFDCFKYSLDLNPKNHAAVYNIGILYNLQGNFEGGRRMFRECLRMHPNDFVVLVALAEIERKLGNHELMWEYLRDAKKLDPESPILTQGFAMAYYDEGNLDAALEFNQKALSLNPADAHLMLNEALAMMTKGHWVDRWSAYEYCLSYKKNERMKGLSQSDAWNGEPMPGKTLLVISDQGAGDCIQFGRFIAKARRLGEFGKVIFMCQPEMLPLVRNIRGIDEVVAFDNRSNIHFDTFTPLLGVMKILKVAPDSCDLPSVADYIVSSELKVEWRHKINRALAEFDETFASDPTFGGDSYAINVGIVWAGDAKHGNDHARSVPISHIMELLSLIDKPKDYRFYSFQVGPKLDQMLSLPEQKMVNLGEDFRHFADTAAAISHMDLMITCDTSVLHVAGAMDIPTIAMIGNPPEWRWLENSYSTNWYPQTLLVRQPKARDWKSVILTIADILNDSTKDIKKVIQNIINVDKL